MAESVNKELVTQVIKNLNMSTMPAQEKMLWMTIIPGMNDKELKEFNVLLEDEIRDIMDLYFKAKTA